jgi:hypothetical protein
VKDIDIRIKGRMVMTTNVMYKVGDQEQNGCDEEMKTGYYLIIRPMITGKKAKVPLFPFNVRKVLLFETGLKSEKNHIEAVRLALKNEGELVNITIKNICRSENIDYLNRVQIVKGTLDILKNYYESIK